MLNFDEKTHTYRHNSIIVPGVTKTLKNAGLTDYSHVPEELLARASNFGRAVDLATDLYDMGRLNLMTLDPALVPYLEGWIKFKRDTGLVVVGLKIKVFSKKYMYAGELDKLVLIKDRLTVIDVKATSQINPAGAIQLAAYLEGYNEGKKVKDKAKDRLIVQLKDDGLPHLPKKEYYSKSDFKVFLGALIVSQWKERHL